MREPGGSDGGDAEKNRSPSGDGSEGRGAFHGIADEAKVIKDFGDGTRRAGGNMLLRTMETTEAVRPRVEHADRLAGLAASVKYFAIQRLNRISRGLQARKEPCPSEPGARPGEEPTVRSGAA